MTAAATASTGLGVSRSSVADAVDAEYGRARSGVARERLLGGTREDWQRRTRSQVSQPPCSGLEPDPAPGSARAVRRRPPTSMGGATLI
ncbi:hypothetical protein GIY23_18595 [Allosaccharopolyspora coralli]|uniref:Uncharacterized protein n=1 Tax=Allosaccharopolyspora coralli TaxID=2665642 RepID=A0A5Q3QA64_9PSEU|nr:hypothetical protein [Allosaccharopolyspora coralli]QGK71263.1 hypothetical protein GIY23_18595 [Allosaccharopolyspora coralli]